MLVGCTAAAELNRISPSKSSYSTGHSSHGAQKIELRSLENTEGSG